MQKLVPYQPLEYFSLSVAKDSSTGEPVVIFAVRPDESTPHNLGLNLPQAQRLLAATILLILLLCGCSTRVEVSRERTAPSDPPAVEKLHTNVAVELLSNEDEAPRPPSPPEEPPTPPEPARKAVEVVGIAGFALIVEGDLHVHQHYHEHLHLEKPPHVVAIVVQVRQPIRQEVSDKWANQ